MLFALPDTAPGGIEHVSSVHLGNIRSINRHPVRRGIHRPSLMSRHVKAERISPGICPDEVTDRGIHLPCCSRSALAAASMIAHSMRLRNSSQPSSYTPVMLPVACQALAAQPPEQ